MTAPAATPRQLWRTFLILAGLAALGGVGFGVYRARRETPTRPPVVDLSGADAEVAALVESARQDVLADPRSARRWGRLGMVLRAHDYGGEANACFEEAERLDPREPVWPYYRGLTLALTDPEGGAACLRRAVERMGDGELTPRFRLVEVLLEQGELDEADRIVRQATARAPEHPRGRLLQARLALARQDGKGAVAALQGCWDDPHARRQARLLAAGAWQRLGEPARAAEAQAQAGRLPPDLPWPDPLVEEVERLVVGVRARLTWAGGLHQQGRTDESVRLLGQVVEDHPREVAAWVLLGQMLRQTRDLPGAERAFTRAVELDPENVDGWFGLGAVRLDRRPREAAAALREAVRLKPDHTLAHYLLGVCLKSSGDSEGARQAWRDALRCQPDHEPTRKALADLGGGAKKP
jgi:cytochrome c-type biogenesis protein CcmH/NrfG